MLAFADLRVPTCGLTLGMRVREPGLIHRFFGAELGGFVFAEDEEGHL